MSHCMQHIGIVGLLLSLILSCENQTPNNQNKREEIQKYFSDTIITYSKGNFPNEWDLNRELRGNDKEVLIWKYIKDELGKEFKFCLTYKTKEDSSGGEMIFIEEMRSEPPNFNEWETALISYAPDLSNPNSIGYHDWLLRSFDHKPEKEEIYKMFDEFMFSLKDQNWMTIEAGIDLELWMKIFGFSPEEYFVEKNGS